MASNLTTLNEDVQVKPISKTSKFWDIQFEDGDYVNVMGKESLDNAICIALMTRFKELENIPLYADFGCRVHELIKANKSEMVRFKIQSYTENVLTNIRRIKEVNSIEVTDFEVDKYKVSFTITSINDEIVNGSVVI